MTKLMEWLTAGVIVISIWVSVVFGFIRSELSDKWMFLIIPSPVILVALFGVYAVIVVLYRVFTFNDCEYAAKELQEQIAEAREDLKRKGFVFE